MKKKLKQKAERVLQNYYGTRTRDCEGKERASNGAERGGLFAAGVEESVTERWEARERRLGARRRPNERASKREYQEAEAAA